MKQSVALVWLRRDLRLNDHAALYHALRENEEVLPVFIFDSNILEDLPRNDRRVAFIHQELKRLQEELLALGSTLLVEKGAPLAVWKELTTRYKITAVYANEDYEPYARQRDVAVTEWLQQQGVLVKWYKDHVIFSGNEVLKDDGSPYTVYTPYSRKWLARLKPFYYKAYPVQKYLPAFAKLPATQFPSLQQIGFQEEATSFPARVIPGKIISGYHETRDLPAIQGTSQLGVHLRFGTLSIRQLLAYALPRNEVYVKELIWRDFYQQILWHFPYVATGSFRSEYDQIAWRNNEQEFACWCSGNTGYPLVDAGMRELNATGYMHNRVRMVTASFLTKHLLIDWRWGERYFAEKLLDFDLAANNGGWQWAAGTGTDAAPYFRIFNPQSQQEKFDKQLTYVRRWVPEYGTAAYVQPIVDHAMARQRCLKAYQQALGK
ncbi:MAG: deoxyribodipyrimidine photo-lyase [Chitinophagales bacterium]